MPHVQLEQLPPQPGQLGIGSQLLLQELYGFILATELLRIKRRAGRVIWLNPLLGNPSYEPLTRGMAAALPLVDHFAAAHNLAALRDLAGRLSL